jgi:hypothetical protein
MPTYRLPIWQQTVGSSFGFDLQPHPSKPNTFDVAVQLKPYFVVQESSSLPSYGAPHTVQSYKELEEALLELHELDTDEDWRIEESVYNSSTQVAATLMNYHIPRPGVFTHGPQSVVFNWTSALDNLYLTITRDTIYVLISSPQEIKYRGEFGAALTSRTSNLFSALGSAQLSSPRLLEYKPSSTTSDLKK